MPFNLLLIPLLGGYIFVRFWNYTKIPMLRADKDRILIRASLAGFFSLIPAFLLSIYVPQLIPCSSDQYCLYRWWAKNLPFEYSGVSVIAFCISSTGWWFLNRVYGREKAVDHAIDEVLTLLRLRSRIQKTGNFHSPLLSRVARCMSASLPINLTRQRRQTILLFSPCKAVTEMLKLKNYT